MDKHDQSPPSAIEPIDLRPDRMRLHAAASPGGDVEAYAARVVSRCTGAQVVIQDDGSSYMKPDLRIEYADRPPGIVECVQDMDREYGSTYASLLKHGERIPMVVELPDTDRIWWASLAGGAQVKLVRARIAGVIGQLSERLGDDLPGMMTPIDRLPSTEEVAALEALGIAEIGSRALVDGETAEINLHPVGASGGTTVPSSDSLDWIRSFLCGPDTADVRKKLNGSGASERHAFIFASYTSPWAAYHLLSRGLTELPPDRPDLPNEITHLWLWTVPPVGRCLAWWPDCGWFDARHRWATQ
jgi:hypothetical protein